MGVLPGQRPAGTLVSRSSRGGLGSGVATTSRTGPISDDEPLVSVVIATRNRPDTLRRAILSVLAQTYRNLEVVVVVDGPDRDARDVLSGFDDRVKPLFLPESVGPGEARNRGVEAASGAWLAFLDDDDEWLPHKLSRQVAAVLGAGQVESFCFSRIIVRDGRGERVWPSRPPRPDEDIGEYLFARRTVRRGEGMIPTITWLMPTELMRSLPFDASLRRHEDADWLIRVSKLATLRWLFVEEPTAIWNVQSRAGHTSEEHDWRFWFSWGQQRRQLMTKRAYAAWMLQAVAAHALRAGERRGSLRAFFEALIHGRPGPWELLAFGAMFLTLRREDASEPPNAGRGPGGMVAHGETPSSSATVAPKTALFFAPHPDDDVLTCGGTIKLRSAGGWDVWIVYLTDGQMSHASIFGIETEPTPEELGRLRRQEAISAASILGVNCEHLVFLGYKDGTLRREKKSVLPAVESLLASLKPAEIYYPSAFDPHPDHAATNWIVNRARAHQRTRAQSYLFTVSDRTESSEDATVRMDISRALEAKRLAIMAHRSQVSALYPGQPRPVLPGSLVNKYLGGEEFFYRSGFVSPSRLWVSLLRVRRRVLALAGWRPRSQTLEG